MTPPAKFRTKEFLDLKKQWYKKLEQDGFKDIEQDDDHLKQWESHAFGSRYSKNLFTSKEKYYQLAGQFLHSHQFKNEKEKDIWELHCEGKSAQEIVVYLSDKSYKAKGHTSVVVTIRKLAKEMLALYANEDD